jgi:hypothetical protein
MDRGDGKMSIFRPWKIGATLALAPLLLSGCADVNRQDVTDARKDVVQEQKESEEARQEAAEKVREEQRQTDEARHEANKPVIDDESIENIREEEKETEQARKEGQEKIQQEEKETREAEQEARETEAKFNAQQARDAYVEQIEPSLEEAEKRIETLGEQGKELEGAAKEAHDTRIETLQTLHKQAGDALDELKSADVLKWQDFREAVETAMKSLSQALDESN